MAPGGSPAASASPAQGDDAVTPPTFRVLRVFSCLPVLLAGLFLTGCREEPPSMPERTEAWQETELPLLAPGSSLAAIAFAGTRGYALGATTGKAGTSYLLLSRSDAGDWTRIQLAAPPDNAVLVDLAAGLSGLALGGRLLQGANPSLIYDERGVAPTAFERSGFGIAAIDGDDTLMLAGGTAVGGALWTSRTPGQWTFALTPLDPLHEIGCTDVFVGNGQALACGFDDGADTLQVVLKMDATDDTWHKVPLGAGVFALTLQCIAASSDGTLMLGGLSGAGGAVPRAFLWRRDTGGAWRALTLPDDDLIGGINDILPAAGGVWYVACGGEGGSGFATIMRVDNGGTTRDLTPFYGSLEQLAVDDAGLLHAVGYRLTPGGGMRQPLLLERS